MLDYNGEHYKLITYKGKAALKFIELPYELKIKIIQLHFQKKHFSTLSISAKILVHIVLTKQNQKMQNFR